ncbi:MAG: cyclic nucleotide-binding domain-containing protein, partial [Candidatus Komeilibacteria bacterium]|nr:cyclic nucleotide-binding domain-containing protein [Candidatus Komeilibacteria bacterium]
NEPSENLFLVAAGEVIITHKLDGGTVTLARLLPGYFFGESGLLEHPHKHRTYAQAVDDTIILKLSQYNFSKLKDKNPHLAFSVINKIARVLSERLNENTMRIGIISAISRLVNDPEFTKNISALANEILKITLQAVPCHQGFLGVYPKHNPDHLKILAATGLSQKELPKELPTDTDIYLQKVHREDNEIMLSSERYAREQKVFYAKRNLLGRAIRIADKNVGIILLADKISGEFTTQNGLILQIISSQVAFALEESFQKEKERGREELARKYIGF